ncbi:MAG: hypothetical protein ACKOEW_07175, partial [Methylocystis sp.]
FIPQPSCRPAATPLPVALAAKRNSKRRKLLLFPFSSRRFLEETHARRPHKTSLSLRFLIFYWFYAHGLGLWLNR